MFVTPAAPTAPTWTQRGSEAIAALADAKVALSEPPSKANLERALAAASTASNAVREAWQLLGPTSPEVVETLDDSIGHVDALVDNLTNAKDGYELSKVFADGARDAAGAIYELELAMDPRMS
jgi:hypothetical protein